jgi:hypothetical protein
MVGPAANPGKETLLSVLQPACSRAALKCLGPVTFKASFSVDRLVTVMNVRNSRANKRRRNLFKNLSFNI